MAKRRLKVGDSILGMLVDGIDETPYVPATLTLTESGVRLDVSYIDVGSPNSSSGTRDWFDSRQVPTNLSLVSLDGDISLFGCESSGYRVNMVRGFGVGRITPEALVFNFRDGEHNDDLGVTELRSTIDGLGEWTGYTGVERTDSVNPSGRLDRVTIELAGVDGAEWDAGAARMKVRAEPHTDKLHIEDAIVLSSSFAQPQPVTEHLNEHRKVANLMSFIFGCPIFFRNHEIKDSRFTIRSLNGDIQDTPYVQLIHASTVKEYERPTPSQKQLLEPLLDITSVGPTGLQQWSDAYDTWGRFIHPASSALNRPGALIENIVVNTSMSFEAAGNLIGKKVGEELTYTKKGKPTTATYGYRCIAHTGLNFDALNVSQAGLARAISDNYNTIKHFDRGEFPDATETHVIGEISILISRVLALKIARPDIQLVGALERRLREIGEYLTRNRLSIRDDGTFSKPLGN
ncbi:hypothetical protein M8Z33_19950 [Streptomyces sp. ZAF1911]|uniref:ApeA N-terminal domain 1-containing protein n=1 Tax=Streptomyces sp. ZAF1911 TaxID=2944129 RepID=UPI00237A1EE3|nr:hypothetical protein [Streptomyces sp. ZAF1911]MDD9378891.1 hypothetical protein [Streptomyces sp. ZAF1911]